MKKKKGELKYCGTIYIVSGVQFRSGEEWWEIDFPKIASIDDWRKIWGCLKEVLSEDMDGAGGVSYMYVKKSRMTGFDSKIYHYKRWMDFPNQNCKPSSFDPTTIEGQQEMPFSTPRPEAVYPEIK